MNIQWVPSPNFDKNRLPITHIFIHWIVGNLAAADAQFKKTTPGTSAHYGIEDDTIHQYVKDDAVAYHAGVYSWNQKSIGIEHSAAPDRLASEKTYKTSGQLIAEICTKYHIPLNREHIKGHKEVRNTQCPGTMDIDKLIRVAKTFMGVDPQIELDKLRTERDRNWTYFAGLCDIMQVQPNYDIAAGELKKLVSFQDVLFHKESQLKDADKKISDLQIDLVKITKEHDKTVAENTSLVEEARRQSDRISKQEGQINTVSEQLDQLKKQCSMTVLTGYKKLIYDLLIKG